MPCAIPSRRWRWPGRRSRSRPATAIYFNTLGVAQYRSGQYAEAIATLEKSLAASKGESDAFDLFFLAMARHKTGQRDRAKFDFERGVRWMGEHSQFQQPTWSEELDRFRGEAEEVLAGPCIELPANVLGAE